MPVSWGLNPRFENIGVSRTSRKRASREGVVRLGLSDVGALLRAEAETRKHIQKSGGARLEVCVGRNTITFKEIKKHHYR